MLILLSVLLLPPLQECHATVIAKPSRRGGPRPLAPAPVAGSAQVMGSVLSAGKKRAVREVSVRTAEE